MISGEVLEQAGMPGKTYQKVFRPLDKCSLLGCIETYALFDNNLLLPLEVSRETTEAPAKS